MFCSFSCYFEGLPSSKGRAHLIPSTRYYNLYELIVDMSVTEMSVPKCVTADKQFTKVFKTVYYYCVPTAHKEQ